MNMNSYNISLGDQYKYFMQLIPDISIFDIIEKQYYDENNTGLWDTDYFFYNDGTGISSSTSFNYIRCLIKVYDNTENITLSNNKYIIYKFDVGADSYFVIIGNKDIIGTSFSSSLSGKNCAGVVF